MTDKMSLSPLKRQTVASALVDELRQRILDLEIAEGAQLRQDEIADTYGVSRIPVREALLQLEGEGLVEASHHRGYTVTRLSLDDIRELFDLRALIEVDLLSHALANIDASVIRNARDILETFDQMLAHKLSERRWGELNWQLHEVLYAPAQRRRSLEIARNLNRNSDRYLRLQLNLNFDTSERARAEHKELVDLCAADDHEPALALLRRHITTARDDLLKFLAERVEQVYNTA